MGKRIETKQTKLSKKHKLIKEGFNPELTENEIIIERGYLKCYDSGNLKFVLVWNDLISLIYGINIYVNIYNIKIGNM